MGTIEKLLLKQIEHNDDINIDDFINLSNDDKIKVEEALTNEIYKRNSKYYKYIPYIENINLVKLMSTGFISQINIENERLMLITYVYIKSPKPDTFEYILEKAKNNEFGHLMLEEILRFKPEYVGLKKYLENIKITNSNNENDNYFMMKNGLVVKINNADCTLYVFDAKQEKWRLDRELYSEYAYGVVHLRPIIFDDKYTIGKPLDIYNDEVL